jgi:UDP-glucose pyrophosphorylase
MSGEEIDKAVILAAGNGSHLRPFSNYVPKPFLPYKDKPIIYHHIKTLSECGIKDIVIITRKDEDNNGAFKLQNEYLKNLSKDPELKEIKIGIAYQEVDPITKKPRGTADAIVAAEEQLKGHNYIVLLGDLIIEGRNEASYIKELIGHFKGTPLFSMDSVARDDAKRGGLVKGKTLEDILEMEEAIEKPDDYILDAMNSADERYNVMWGGVYILNKNSMPYLKNVKQGKDGELNITDAISLQCKMENSRAYGLLINKDKYICKDFGTTDHWLENNLEKENFEKFINSIKLYPEEFARMVHEYVRNKYGISLL